MNFRKLHRREAFAVTKFGFIVLFIFLSVLIVCYPVRAEETDKVSHVILISIDGLRPDAIKKLGERLAPNLHDMIQNGASTLNARTDPDRTNTMPNHTCMLTGRGVLGSNGHEYIDNKADDLSIHKNKGSYVASIFDVAKEHGLKTAFVVSKKKFRVFLNSYGGDLSAGQGSKIDAHYIGENDGQVYEVFHKMTGGGLAQLTFLHFADTDIVGHRDGWSLKKDSPYLITVAGVDRLLGLILKDIRDNPRLADSTVIIVTSDHGGSGKNHQENTKMEHYRIPLIIWGKGVARGMDLYKMNKEIRRDPKDKQLPYGVGFQPIRNGDAANCAMAVLDLPMVPGSMIGNPDYIRVKNNP